MVLCGLLVTIPLFPILFLALRISNKPFLCFCATILFARMFQSSAFFSPLFDVTERKWWLSNSAIEGAFNSSTNALERYKAGAGFKGVSA